MEGKAPVNALTGFDDLRRIDLGIALDALAFNIPRDGDVVFSEPGLQLIFFAMRLFERLQKIGTALAVNIGDYEQSLRNNNV